jgi:hypothetical protein
MPAAERIVLWLRHNLPAQAEEIISLAQQYYLHLQLADSTLTGE